MEIRTRRSLFTIFILEIRCMNRHYPLSVKSLRTTIRINSSLSLVSVQNCLPSGEFRTSFTSILIPQILIAIASLELLPLTELAFRLSSSMDRPILLHAFATSQNLPNSNLLNFFIAQTLLTWSKSYSKNQQIPGRFALLHFADLNGRCHYWYSRYQRSDCGRVFFTTVYHHCRNRKRWLWSNGGARLW